MTELNFDGAQVRELLKRNTGGDVFLVKDEGIYLMNEGQGNPDGGVIVYADGFHKDARDVWERTHDISGDDFCEHLPPTTLAEVMAPTAVKHLKVKLTAKRLRLDGVA